MKNTTKHTLKTALKVWGRIVVATVMCAVLYLSMSVLGNGLFGRTVGYRIAQTDEAGTTKLVEEHYFVDGETEDSIPEVGEGQTVMKITEIPRGVRALLDVLTSLMMLFLLGIFPYNLLWELGGKDDTKVRYKGKTPDPLRGLRIGALATIPAALLYIGMWIVKITGKGTLYLAIYRITQIPYLPYINAVLGTAAEPGKLPLGGLVACALPLIFVPVVCAVSYRLGFRKFSIKEHLTYKKASDSIETPEKTDSEI